MLSNPYSKNEFPTFGLPICRMRGNAMRLKQEARHLYVYQYADWPTSSGDCR